MCWVQVPGPSDLRRGWVTATEAPPNTVRDVAEAPRSQGPQTLPRPCTSHTQTDPGLWRSSLFCFLHHGVMFCLWRELAQMKRVSFIRQILTSQPQERGASRETARISQEGLSGRCRHRFAQRRVLVILLAPQPSLPLPRQLSTCPSDQTSSRLRLLQGALLTLPFFRV